MPAVGAVERLLGLAPAEVLTAILDLVEVSGSSLRPALAHQHDIELRRQGKRGVTPRSC